MKLFSALVAFGWQALLLATQQKPASSNSYQAMKKNHIYIYILRAILNKSWRQHPTKQQLYGHLPPTMKTIQVRWTRHAGICWRSRDKLISDILLWTFSRGRAKAGWPARTYIQQLCADTGCSLEDLPKAMDDKEGWWKGSGIFVLMVWHDDDDELVIYIQPIHT